MREQTATKDHRSVGRRTSLRLRKQFTDLGFNPIEFDGIRNRNSATFRWTGKTNHLRPKLQPLVAEISWSKILLPEENALIGIIICRDKNKTVVEYALRTASRPIGVATYTIVPELPEAYRAELPSPEAIAERLQAWTETEANDE